MSLLSVRRTIKGAMEDGARGFTARMEDLARAYGWEAEDFGRDPTKYIRTDFDWVSWRLSGMMQPGTRPRLIYRPRRQAFALVQPGDVERASAVTLDLSYATVFSDVEQLEDNVELAAMAMASVLDWLPEYARETGGTTVEVVHSGGGGDGGGIGYAGDATFGDYGGEAGAGVVTTSGVSLTITVYDLDTQ
jgi:hypothetical protein